MEKPWEYLIRDAPKSIEGGRGRQAVFKRIHFVGTKTDTYVSLLGFGESNAPDGQPVPVLILAVVVMHH